MKIRRPVVIAHAKGEEHLAAKLAEPLERAGYEVFYLDQVKVGDSETSGWSKALAQGGPVVFCGTAKAIGTRLPNWIANAAKPYEHPRVVCVQMEGDACVENLPWAGKPIKFWLDEKEALNALVCWVDEYCSVSDLSSSTDTTCGPILLNLPHRNPHFTGRKDILDRLGKQLESSEKAAITQAIHGLGGIGKSALAIEHAYRQMDRYNLVCWVPSESFASMVAAFQSLARKLNLPEKDIREEALLVEAVREHLEHNQRWLIIFDNAEKPEELDTFLPRFGDGHVLITSRSTVWDHLAEELPLEQFQRPESIAYLLERTCSGEDQRESANELAEALGDLPLALVQAATYLVRVKSSIRDYLKLYEQHELALLDRVKLPDDLKKVGATWDISVEAADAEWNGAKDLMKLLAFFDPDDIPVQMLKHGREHFPEELKTQLTNDLDWNDALGALSSYSMIELKPDAGISVHRMVQAVTRASLSEKELRVWASAALRVVNASFPNEPDDPNNWSLCAELLPHALATADYSEKLGVPDKNAARLINQAAMYLSRRGEFMRAKELFERALEIARKVYGEEHPNVGVGLNNLGAVLHDMGDLDGAKDLHERALRIDRKVYGEEHPNVALRLNNLGGVLHDLGDLNGAKEYLEQAFEIDGKVYGEEHPNVARDLNNLGRVLHDMGDLDGAKDLHERALRIDRKVYGEEHPKVATRLNNLGALMHDLGDLPGAKAHYERALEIDRKVYGEDHPNIAIRLNNLGGVLQDMGDLQGAKANYEQALEILETFLPPGHPKIELVRGNLEQVLYELKKRDLK